MSRIVWNIGRQRFILILRITCTKARSNGAGLPCYSAATDIPAEGICNYVPLLIHHSNWLAAGRYGTPAARLICTTSLSPRYVICRLYVASTEHTVEYTVTITSTLSRCPGSHHISLGRLRLVLPASAHRKDGAAATWRPIHSKRPSQPALDQAKCLICRAGVGGNFTNASS